MNDEIKRQMSALMDGELEDHEVSPVLRGICADADLCDCWDDYQCIGSVLREDGDPAFDITGGVMARLAEEPTVLAPSVRASIGRRRPLLALAASATGVALVGVLALVPSGNTVSPANVAASEPSATSRVVRPTASSVSPRLQEYVVAHQAHAPAAGASRGIRTVAMARGER